MSIKMNMNLITCIHQIRFGDRENGKRDWAIEKGKMENGVGWHYLNMEKRRENGARFGWERERGRLSPIMNEKGEEAPQEVERWWITCLGRPIWVYKRKDRYERGGCSFISFYLGCGGWSDGSLKEGVGKRRKRRTEIFPLVYVSEWKYRYPDKK